MSKQVLIAPREFAPGFSDLALAQPCQGGYLRYLVPMAYRYLFTATDLNIDDSDTNMAGQG
jgi:hypothetical protein